LDDIKKGDVFPAIRNNRVDFYYKGGKLFSFDKRGFKTHIKYACVCDFDKDYIYKQELKNIKNIMNFVKGYERIKENCAHYSGIEAEEVGRIYQKFSYLNSNLNVVVLDIEVSFGARDEDRKQDRIDLLLLNKKEKRLRFYEVKDFSNKDIWSKKGTKPRVVGQIKRYKGQIGKNEGKIIDQYSSYINIVSELFGLELKKPEYVDREVCLLIFGFDIDQLQGRLKTLLEQDGSLKDIKYYRRGNVSGLKDLTVVWNRCN